MIISTKNLTKKYGTKNAVNDITLEIPEGKTVGLIGPNGSGKTTTIRMLTGQISPTKGSVEYDGKNIKEMGKSVNELIGIMPQDIVIWDYLKVEENLDYTAKLFNLDKKFAKQRKEMLIDKLKLSGELDTVARNLSGGYKRRLNLAISIMHDPKIIFLDEPTPGVDPQSRRAMWDFIHELNRSKKYSILLTDHYLDEAEKVCDYIIILDYGKIIAEGTLSELKRKYLPSKILKIEFKNTLPKDSVQKIKKLYKKVVFDKKSALFNCDKPEKEIPGLLKILANDGVDFLDISLKDSSLEDIFLLLTGREIRNE